MTPRRERVDLSDTALAEPAPAVSSIEPAALEGSPQRGVIRSGKLAGMSMGRAIWVLSWPVLIESFLNSLVGVVDTTLAAGVSESATDAIGGAAYFLWFVLLVGTALGVGAGALISRAVGRGRLAVGSAVVGQCVTLSLVGGVVVGIAVAAVAPLVARILSLEPDAHRQCVLFIQLCALAVPAQTVMMAGVAACRAAGDSMRPLIVMIVVNGVNLIVSLLLSGVDISVAGAAPTGEIVRRVILENPSPFDMGVTGIALGTSIAWSIGAIIILWMLAGGIHGIRLRTKRLAPHWHTIRRLVRVGLPNLSETFGLWLGNFLIILIVGFMRDPGLLGSNVITVRIEAFSFLPGFAMSLAAGALAGTYLGAGSPALARLAVIRCELIAAALMGLFGLAFILFPLPITGLFTQQPAHLQMVPDLLALTGKVQVVFSLSIVLRGALRGAGDTSSVMWITWISIWGIRLPLAWLCCGVELPIPGGGVLPNPAPLQALGVHPLIGLWIGLCAEIHLRSALFTWVFIRGRWMTKRV